MESFTSWGINLRASNETVGYDRKVTPVEMICMKVTFPTHSLSASMSFWPHAKIIQMLWQIVYWMF